MRASLRLSAVGPATAAVAIAALILTATEPHVAAQRTAADFQWRGTVLQGGAVEIKGVNGDVNAQAGTGSEVEVTAVKKARRSDPESVRIEVLSDPPGASVRDLENGVELGTTPLSAELPRRAGEVTLRLEKDGFVPFVRRVQLDAESAVKVILPPHEQEVVSASGSEPAPVKAAVGKGRGNRDAVVDPFEL